MFLQTVEPGAWGNSPGVSSCLRACLRYSYAARAACVFEPMGTSWLRTRTSARSSEAVQIRKNSTLASNKFRCVRLIEINILVARVKCATPPAYGRDPTKVVGAPSNKLQTREVIHGNASLAGGISGIEMVPICSNLGRGPRANCSGLEIVGGAIRKTGRAENTRTAHPATALRKPEPNSFISEVLAFGGPHPSEGETPSSS